MKLAALVLVALLGGVAHADPPTLRDAVMQRFDRNQDGQLQPRERKQATRALRRLAKRLQHQQARQHMRQNMRPSQRERFIRRFDLNHDGNVGPGELPPALADELRPLDANGNGWLDGDELP